MRVLLTTHGTPHDEAALRIGAQVACCAGDPATILTVIDDEEDRDWAEAVLARARELLAEVESVSKVRIGPVAREIIREAAEGQHHLVVVGERQHVNALCRLLAGSTALRVAEHAPCPVLVAKGKVRPLRRILLCDSGAQGPLAGVPAGATRREGEAPSLLTRFTAQLAEMLRGEEEITVLHVMSQISAGPGVRGKQLRADVHELIEEHTPEGELLKQDIQVLERPGVRVRPKVRHGLVVDEILAEATAEDYDLVVIGANRSESWQRLLLDNLAQKIVMSLDRSILIIR